MFKLIGLLVVLALGAAGMRGWDTHRPWGVHLNLVVWRPGFDLPDSLATQRDKALARAQAEALALNQCHANVSALDGAVASQNAAVEAVQREGEARVAQSAAAAASARAVAASYRIQAQGVLEAFAGSGDHCAAADGLILKEAGQ